MKVSGVNVRLEGNAAPHLAAEQDCRNNHGYLAKISNEKELKAMKFLAGKIEIAYHSLLDAGLNTDYFQLWRSKLNSGSASPIPTVQRAVAVIALIS